MTDHSPITPTPELVEQWRMDYIGRGHAFIDVAAEIARWAADQELEACCQALYSRYVNTGLAAATATTVSQELRDWLRTTRRPKPPSLKKQALEALQFVDEKLDLPLHNHCFAIHTIRRALEALND